MNTVIIYYSKHHGNTKKLLDAISEEFPDIDLIDVTDTDVTDLTGYDRIGIASGVYFSDFAKQIKEYAKKHLPAGKQVFLISTQGAPMGRYFGGIKKIIEEKGCTVIAEYACRGFDTFGPFKAIGGIAKGHPTDEEIRKATEFYRRL